MKCKKHFIAICLIASSALNILSAQVDWSDNKSGGNYDDIRIIIQQLADEFISECPLQPRYSGSYTIEDWMAAKDGSCMHYVIRVEISWMEEGGFLRDTRHKARGIVFYNCSSNNTVFYLSEKDFVHQAFGLGGCLNKTSKKTIKDYSEKFGSKLTKWNFVGDQIYWR